MFLLLSNSIGQSGSAKESGSALFSPPQKMLALARATRCSAHPPGGWRCSACCGFLQRHRRTERGCAAVRPKCRRPALRRRAADSRRWSETPLVHRRTARSSPRRDTTGAWVRQDPSRAFAPHLRSRRLGKCIGPLRRGMRQWQPASRSAQHRPAASSRGAAIGVHT